MANNPPQLRFIPKARELFREVTEQARLEILRDDKHFTYSQVAAFTARVSYLFARQVLDGRWDPHYMEEFRIDVLWGPWKPGNKGEDKDEILYTFSGAPLSIMEEIPDESQMN